MLARQLTDEARELEGDAVRVDRDMAGREHHVVGPGDQDLEGEYPAEHALGWSDLGRLDMGWFRRERRGQLEKAHGRE